MRTLLSAYHQGRAGRRLSCGFFPWKTCFGDCRDTLYHFLNVTMKFFLRNLNIRRMGFLFSFPDASGMIFQVGLSSGKLRFCKRCYLSETILGNPIGFVFYDKHLSSSVEPVAYLFIGLSSLSFVTIVYHKVSGFARCNLYNVYRNILCKRGKLRICS